MRQGAFLVGMLALALSLALWAIAFRAKLSWWGFAHLVVFALFAVGCLTAPWRRTAWRGLVRASVGAFYLILVARVFNATHTPTISLERLPGDHGARLLNAIVVERDGMIPAAMLLHATGGLRDAESAALAPALLAAYDRMGPDADAPTPAVATYLGLQRPTSFDAIVVDHAHDVPTGAVIFLHGYAGNFLVYCWEIAEAAERSGFVTVCPSVGARGDWWSPVGAENVQATLEFLRAKGLRRVVLAGLSNGAAGASVIAAARPKDFAGLVLISGTRAYAPPPMPVLVVQGSRDTMMPTNVIRAYAERGGASVRYVELDGGHLVFLTRWKEMRQAVRDFLAQETP